MQQMHPFCSAMIFSSVLVSWWVFLMSAASMLILAGQLVCSDQVNSPQCPQRLTRQYR